MSSLIAQAALLGGGVWPDDARLQPQWWRADDVEVRDFDDYTSPWWPGGANILCDRNGSGDKLNPSASVWFERPEITRGHNMRFGVLGVTRDVYGSPLGGVTVKLFRTSTDELVHSTVSDPLGNYAVSTPYFGEGHYLVTYKTGTPDVFGSSPNTLTGA